MTTAIDQPFDKRALRNAFGSFMTGVTVVTAFSADNQPIGFTANSFASVSLEPPLLLVSIGKNSSNLETFKEASGFAVNILAEHQQDISNTFASKVEDRFAQVAWYRGPNGAPLLKSVCAWFDCDMQQQIDAGDHIVMIGAIKAFEHDPEADGLGYMRGAYYRPSLTQQASAMADKSERRVVMAVIDREDAVYLQQRDEQLALPELELDKGESHEHGFRRLLTQLALTASSGVLFSVFAAPERDCSVIAYRCVSEDGQPKDGRFWAQSELDKDKLSVPYTQILLERYWGEKLRGNYGIYFSDRMLQR